MVLWYEFGFCLGWKKDDRIKTKFMGSLSRIKKSAIRIEEILFEELFEGNYLVELGLEEKS